MKITDFKGKKVTVMGLGLLGGGVAVARFLAEAGASVTVTDIKLRGDLGISVEKLKKFKNIKFVFGQHRPEDFTTSFLVVKNPAIPWDNKYIKMALEKKIPVEMDSSLFFKLCKNDIIGVTGTKGKTTTSSLIWEILKADGKSPVKVGIGQTSVLGKLKDFKKDSVAVFELSSWRLSALGRFKMSPKVAVITNLFPDHLNFYSSMEKYVADKKNIFLFQKAQDFCVVNVDNEEVAQLEEEIFSRLVRFSRKEKPLSPSLFVRDETIFWNDGNDEKKLMEISEIKLPGKHNLENVLAAAGATLAMGVKAESIKKAVLSFSGVKHRLELVGVSGGVKFYNDTAATTPESAIASLESFPDPVVLIAGGSDKKLSMASFSEVIEKRAKETIFLKGEATDKIVRILKKDGYANFKIASNMEEAVALARKVAVSGDTVLLSPGAASFGLFSNEFDRGDKFCEEVKKMS